MLLIAQEIPKKSDKIIVTSTLTAEQNFIKVKQQLADIGIDIATQDRDIFQIKTGDIATKWGGTLYYVIFCKEGHIQITGNAKTGIKLGLMDADPYSPIVFRGMKGSMTKESFMLMNEFAKKLGNNIEYQSSVMVNEPKKNNNDDTY